VESEAAALQQIQASSVDALVVFGSSDKEEREVRGEQEQQQQQEEERRESSPQRPEGISPQQGKPQGTGQVKRLQGLPPGMLSYVIRTNRTDLPPPGLLRDLFDVSPGDMPLPGNLLW